MSATTTAGAGTGPLKLKFIFANHDGVVVEYTAEPNTKIKDLKAELVERRWPPGVCVCFVSHVFFLPRDIINVFVGLCFMKEARSTPHHSKQQQLQVISTPIAHHGVVMPLSIVNRCKKVTDLTVIMGCDKSSIRGVHLWVAFVIFIQDDSTDG